MSQGLCDECGIVFPASLLACPACGTLAYRAELKQLWNASRESEAAGFLSEAAESLRRALDLLPPDSVQRGQLQTQLREISARIDRGEGTGARTEKKKFSFRPQNWGASLAGIGVLLLKFKAGLFLALSKGKLLLLGFKGGLPLLGLLGSFGVYWATWGWAFAAGLMGAIYLHELGHVAALKRFGFKTSAPVFLPGLGAFIRLSQRPASAVEDARIGLAGPAAGLAATLLFGGAWMIWPKPLLIALITSNAWINLFNLLPISPLDGGRGMNSLDDVERWAVALTAGGLAFWSGSLLLGAIAFIAFLRAAEGGTLEGDRKGAAAFCLLILALALLSQWKP